MLTIPSDSPGQTGPRTVSFRDTVPEIDLVQFAEHMGALHEGASGAVGVAWCDVRGGPWRHAWMNVTSEIRESITADTGWRYWLRDGHAPWQLYTPVGSFRTGDSRTDNSFQRTTRRTQASALELPGMWADLDVTHGVEGHFRDEAHLELLVETLPPPTLRVASGSGGCHLYWLTRRRLPVDDETRELLDAWHELLVVHAGRVGGHVDNVQEPSRVLRAAGTVRWSKPSELAAGEPTFHRVELITHDGPRYDMEELTELARPHLLAARERRQRTTEAYRLARDAEIAALKRRGLTNATRVQLERRFNVHQDWEPLLNACGWTLHSDGRTTGHGTGRARYWTRPGKDPRDGASASTDFTRGDGTTSQLMTFFSSEVPQLEELVDHAVPQAHRGCTTKYRLALVLLYDGDEGRLLRDVVRGNGRLPL